MRKLKVDRTIAPGVRDELEWLPAFGSPAGHFRPICRWVDTIITELLARGDAMRKRLRLNEYG
jgi:hypothetical protein